MDSIGFDDQRNEVVEHQTPSYEPRRRIEWWSGEAAPGTYRSVRYVGGNRTPMNTGGNGSSVLRERPVENLRMKQAFSERRREPSSGNDSCDDGDENGRRHRALEKQREKKSPETSEAEVTSLVW